MADDLVLQVLQEAQERLKVGSRLSSYANDPVRFAEDVLGVTLWSKQKDVLNAVMENSHTAVRAAHGPGKSFLASLLACWWVATRPEGESIVVTTAPTFSQISTIIWAEIKMHFDRAKKRYDAGLSPMKLPGYITAKNEWKSDTGTVMAFGRKPADSDAGASAFQGIHRRYVFVIVDEACGISEQLFTGVEAITTGKGSRVLAIGNPDDPASEFKKFFDVAFSDFWDTIDISAFDIPSFTRHHEGHYKGCDNPQCLVRQWAKRWDLDRNIPEEVLDKLTSEKWVEERRKAWGEGSPLWQSKIIGEFPLQSVNTLFSAQTLNTGIDTEITPLPTTPVILGVDLARFGPDYSTIYINEGGKVRLLDYWGGKADEVKADGMESAAKVHQWAVNVGATEVRIDSEGIGGPILDRILMLSHDSYAVIAMKGSRPSPDINRWYNSRAYWYDKAREDMFTGNVDIDPMDRKLLDELEQIQYHFKNQRKSLQIESKDDMAKRGLKSPDYADAFVYAIADLSYITDNPIGRYGVGEVLNMSVAELLGLESMDSWSISPV